MKKNALILMGLCVALISISGCTKKTVTVQDDTKLNYLSSTMRVLWTDHVVWTRNVIINIVGNSPGTTEVLNRLLKNQVDIGNSIKPYYGEAGGNALGALLHTHVVIAGDLIAAARDGDMLVYNLTSADWYENGDSIAAFLNTANPTYFPLPEWEMMMKTHLDYTVEEVTARVNQDYAGDVIAYDKVFNEMMMMSDKLSVGISKQFPNQF